MTTTVTTTVTAMVTTHLDEKVTTMVTTTLTREWREIVGWVMVTVAGLDCLFLNVHFAFKPLETLFDKSHPGIKQ